MKYSIACVLLFSPFLGFGQLDLKEIMTGQDYIGHWPENQFWSYDGSNIYFDWQTGTNRGAPMHAYHVKTKLIHQLDSIEETKAISNDLNQADYKVLYFERDNALASLYKINGDISLCYQSFENLSSIQRVVDPNVIILQQDINLLEWKNKEGKSTLRPLTNFQLGDQKMTTVDSSYLVTQQDELFDYFKDKVKLKEWRKKQGDFHLFAKPKPIYLGTGDVSTIQINPFEEYVAVIMTKSANEVETSFPEFITESGRVELNSARSKVTNKEPSQRLGIVSLVSDTMKWVDFSKLSEIRKKPNYLDTLASSLYDKDRSIFIHPLQFSKIKNLALCDIRSADNKDRWIVLLDVEKGLGKEVNHQHDDAWIGGPGISSWNQEEAVLGWLEDGKSFYFQSEVSGYSHLYSYDIETGQTNALTSGNFEIHGVQLSKDKKRFYITANKTHPGNRDFYHLDCKSLVWTPILTANGYHDVQVSPDEKLLLVRYSNANTPWELFVAANTASTKMLQITHSSTAKFQSYPWRTPPIIQYVASDSVKVSARLYEPKITEKNGAAVLFVHGAGYLQNAHNYWSNYYREYMFHNLLCDLGYTVLDVDYRASEGYGRDYRTAVYRYMGGRDLDDFIDAKDFLVKQYGIDSNRIGIYGGSYGGFITLMGLLTKPNEFACGAALRSVTDWAHYNHEYTSNILNYPETDPQAYRKSSPIYYAENLAKPLLMLHGMVDDNVQFQDIVRLSQRFIELGKKDWELAIYQTEAHGFRASYSWYDEYRRIFELFDKQLKK
jgi:dipeptidyl aminopeptidase/acylaminoacyl peptidase